LTFAATKFVLQASVVLSLLLAAILSPAETLTGTVKNGTSDKPAAGDEVVLLKLGQGMEEAGRTKADGKGAFSFKVDDTSTPHLVRAVHQGVTFHRVAPPGTTSVDVVVYDVSKKIDALSVTADVLRFQARSNELQGIRLFAVDNKSNPPRTQMSEQNFEFYLPDGAEVDTAIAMTEGGQPLTTAPVPQKEKNRYAFLFPLRPGETQFQVVFHLPYGGEASIDPKELYGTQHFVVMLPKTMQFASASGASFASMNDPRQPDAIVEVASNTRAGQPLAFKVSGTGILTDKEGSNQEADGPASGSTSAGRDSRPGGGLGPPIDAPDPLEKYRFYILGGFALVMAAGAFYIGKRPRTASVPDFGPPNIELSDASRAATSTANGRSGLLLEALKEELFELEVEHKQGHISQQEYEKAKAALDQTLERALKRAVAKTT
jgi:hypothetical protein